MAAFLYIPTTVDNMTDKYEKVCVKLQTKNQNVVICHLVGLSLETYNTLETCLNGKWTIDSWKGGLPCQSCHRHNESWLKYG